MSSYYLKNKSKGLYLKNIDTEKETIEFTKNLSEAKPYPNGSWFAETELEFAQFHFPQEEEILNNMACVYEEY
jgi:hypothetical protein